MTYAYCAVFDLDETLIRPKSMLSVLDAYHRASTASPAEAERRIAMLRERVAAFGASHPDRREQNRHFYRQLAGIEVAAMRAAAARWFEAMRPTLYHDAVVDELVLHQRNGAATIVVTGSFRDAVEPIAADLGIEHVVCAEPEIADARYTGELLGAPTIGQGKADALGAYLFRRRLSLEVGYAYGDHDSDIPLLSLATRPVAVGGHPALIRHAASRGWRIIHHRQGKQHGRP
ncbi:HAD family phosphatase [Burkholderia ambifaria]|jgi:HAD superfamily hydrolase (TIGR01490 family)|uniref:HAD-superfamily subfamily IB hydrolase, TIGR01490 n=1 Tax=Burkholderia ambifaria (strain MC40-6) TaxID=398577 RepID=B1Z5U3_BURA4|nr:MULTISPECIES: HAD family phosphatase [Burkholderia]ACB68139.1 HAD-superfamily subfamily IB hydrolase, TIGR01490 [Burkholderia ambifaria MC40-6]MBR8063140.1 HAD family phosphatase [Burkholderia ambifaria]MBR8255100.1 HAD family phosphatase [Burkholderia ambifaria]QDW55224.1 HAD-IB family hydrolase [Burkholderia sp. KBS0801]